MSEAEMRQIFVDLQVGDVVEVVHHVKIGSQEFDTHTVGSVVKKERRRSGMDSGFARNWDDKYWFDQLTLQKDDGELTTLTIDEYTDLRKVGAHQQDSSDAAAQGDDS